MRWHEQTWEQIRDADKSMPVVVPLGSCEQHGHHLPLWVDTFQVDTVAQAVEKRMSDRIVLVPALWLGSSHHHRDFPGTISLRPSLYSQVIQDVARCIMGAGFERIFFLNGHGGNEVPVSQALSELVAIDDDADGRTLAFASWWSVARDAIGPEHQGMATPRITHACEYETSLILAIRPDLVQQGRAVDALPALSRAWASSEGGGRVHTFRRFHRLTASGNMGQPTAATAEKGQALLEAIIGEVCAFLEDFAKWPALPALGPQ